MIGNTLMFKHINAHCMYIYHIYYNLGDFRRHGRDRMVVGFISTYSISVYHH